MFAVVLFYSSPDLWRVPDLALEVHVGDGGGPLLAVLDQLPHPVHHEAEVKEVLIQSPTQLPRQEALTHNEGDTHGLGIQRSLMMMYHESISHLDWIVVCVISSYNEEKMMRHDIIMILHLLLTNENSRLQRFAHIFPEELSNGQT